jgi:pimeloyl-ACP methyl ester carboxylesterase
VASAAAGGQFVAGGASGLRASQALAAVLLYRLVSFWLVASAGWLVFLRLRTAGQNDTARQLAQDLPHARLQLVAGAGHHPPRRAPHAVADAIAAWLQILDSSDPDKCM